MTTWRYTMGQRDARIGLKYPALSDDDEYMDGWDEEQARQSGGFPVQTDEERAEEQRIRDELDNMFSSNT